LVNIAVVTGLGRRRKQVLLFCEQNGSVLVEPALAQHGESILPGGRKKKRFQTLFMTPPQTLTKD
jgi:hypothetical protein